MIDDKVLKIFKNLPEKTDAILITSEENRRYFTGFPSSDGYLLISRSEAYFIVDFRYFEKAQETVGSNYKVILLDDLKTQLSELTSDIKTIALEDDYVTVKQLRYFKQLLPEIIFEIDISLSDILMQARAVKSKSEIANIIDAQRIAETAYDKTIEIIKHGVSERDIACELEYQMKKAGSEKAAFETIAVSGKNSSLPHGVCTDKKLENGDFVVIDFGAVVNGYCSDMTRTVAIGHVSDKQQSVYDIVMEALTSAESQIKPGAVCSDIDFCARDIIYKNGYKGRFGHALGHSVGLKIHEKPCFAPKDDTILEAGMVITVEPGIYLPGEFGVRIEDLAVITNNGCEIISKTDKKLMIL